MTYQPHQSEDGTTKPLASAPTAPASEPVERLPSEGDRARWALAAFNKAKREDHRDDYGAMGAALKASAPAPASEPATIVKTLQALTERLDGYLNSPEQVALGEEMRALIDKMQRTPAPEDSQSVGELLDVIQQAYGHLWRINNEPGTPNQYASEKAAYEARRLLRDVLTHEQRGHGINKVLTPAPRVWVIEFKRINHEH